MSPSKKERQEQGAKSYADGKAFEGRVAEIFHLLNYDVELGRNFSSRQVDLFLTQRIDDLTIYRAIECKAGPVKAEHIDSFLAKLRLVRKKFPNAIGSIISGATFTDAVKEQASEEGITLTTFRELSAKLFDGHGYAKGLHRRLEFEQGYNAEMYVEPRIVSDRLRVAEQLEEFEEDASGESIAESLLEEYTEEEILREEPAFIVMDKWLSNPDVKLLALLGDVGTGKSFLSKMVAMVLARKFEKDPVENPLLILVDLRDTGRQASFKEVIQDHLANHGLDSVNWNVFQYSLSKGHIVLILDGFDELAARVTPQRASENFQELAAIVVGKAKVLLTCRNHYFKSRQEEQDVLLASNSEYEAEGVAELYWDMILRDGFQMCYLQPFTSAEIGTYLELVRPATADKDLERMSNTYNLMELSRRPMLLDMIVKYLDRFEGGDVNVYRLYDLFTSAWIVRDDWRGKLTADDKLSYLIGLAWNLWVGGEKAIHHSEIIESLTGELKGRFHGGRQYLEFDNEVRAASFLTRDEPGYYGFAHNSFMEFFIARHVAKRIDAGNLECLSLKRLQPEIVSFLALSLLRKADDNILVDAVTSEYRPNVSENALLILYRMRRIRISQENKQSKLANAAKIRLPSHVKMQSANLEKVFLEGSVFEYASFEGAILSEAKLAGLTLENCNLKGANCSKSDFSSSELENTSFENSQLDYAILSGSEMSKVSFVKSNLTGADLLRCKFSDVKFDEALLTGSLIPSGLETKSDILALLRAFNHEDQRSKDALFSAVYPQLERMAFRILLKFPAIDDLSPEDLVAELYLTLLSRDNFTFLANEEQFYRYCHRIIFNKVYDYKRGKRFNYQFDSYDEHLSRIGFQDTLDKEQLILLQKYIDELNETGKSRMERVATVAYRRLFEGASRKELAKMYGKDVKTITRDWQVFVAGWEQFKERMNRIRPSDSDSDNDSSE